MQNTKVISHFVGEYRFLSNFYPCRIVWDDEEYPSAEHAFQAAKTLDPLEATSIRKASTPFQAKQRGRKVTLRDDWEEIKDFVMLEILRRKFSVLEFRDRLLATKDANLVEGNTWGDLYWGVCDGRGKNRLGELLMHVREEQKAQKDLPHPSERSCPAVKPGSGRKGTIVMKSASTGVLKTDAVLVPKRRVVVVDSKFVAGVKKGHTKWDGRKS